MISIKILLLFIVHFICFLFIFETMEDDENSLKIVLLGDSGIGKTTIVSKFVTGTIPDAATPTVGAAFTTKDFNFHNSSYRLLIWDTAGQELYRGLTPMYYRNAVIAIIVFDLSRSKTFDSCKYWINELHENSEVDALIIICGNKCDLEKKVDSGDCEIFATQNNAFYCETSAKTGSGIERLFQLAISEYENKRGKSTVKQQNVETVNITREQVPKKEGGCC